VILDTYPYFCIGVIHLVGCAVFGAGALYHAIKGAEVLADAEVERARKFHFEWDDTKKTGFILGHHLLFLGVACSLFVGWAALHGIYDPTIGEVRTVSPAINPLRVFKYGWAVPGFNPFFVDNLEDVMGGHLFVVIMLLGGGFFHILVPPFDFAKRIYVQSGEGLLSYALAGLSIMGFTACYFTAVNDLVFPVELYGPVLEAKLSVTPYFADTLDLVAGHTARFWVCNFHFFLAFMLLQGHLWHALRASGFDFNRVPQALSSVTE
ncbi:MAG: chlorophyll a/b binding light-harvesting protein, partial [Thermosynechococcaceae cyanobacterium]